MIAFGPLVTMVAPLLISIYTVNYGRWAWKTKRYRGAIGLYVLAALCTLVPSLVIIQAL